MDASLKSVLGTLRADGVLGGSRAPSKADARPGALSCSISISSDKDGCAADLVDFELINLLSSAKLLRVKACAARDDEDALYLAVANVKVRDEAELKARERALQRLLLREHRPRPYTLLFDGRAPDGCARAAGSGAWVQSAGAVVWPTKGAGFVSLRPGKSPAPLAIAEAPKAAAAIVACAGGGLLVGSSTGMDVVSGRGDDRVSAAVEGALPAGAQVLALDASRDGEALFAVVKTSSDEGVSCSLMCFHAAAPAAPVRLGAAPKSCTAVVTDATAAAGGRVYMTDTTARCVRALEVEPHDGRLRAHADGVSKFAAFSEDDGLPVGIALDSAGALWVALWFGSQVVQLSADGREVTQRVHLPVPNPVSVVFGGPTRDTLYIITSADERGALAPLAPSGADPRYTGADAGAGGVFKVRTTVGGLAKRDCKVAFPASGGGGGAGGGSGGGGGGGGGGAGDAGAEAAEAAGAPA